MSERPPVQFKLRLPAELLWRLEKASDVSGLSVTAEIVRRLYASFPADFEQRFIQSLREEIERQEALIAEFTSYLDGSVTHPREKALTPKLIETGRRQIKSSQETIKRLTAEIDELIYGERGTQTSSSS